jgi:hypothetical protein
MTHERDEIRRIDRVRRAGPPAGPERSRDDKRALEDLGRAAGNAALARLLDPGTAGSIEAALGGGVPLDRSPAAHRAVHDGSPGRGGLGDVRLHDDATSAALAARLGATAFTFGKDIFLAGDAPALETPEGQAMLRHELAHVEQQRGTGVGKPRRVSHPASPMERQAARAAEGSGAAAGSEAPSSQVHRQEEEEEEVATLPADTVARQEEEEEEVATLPADTVARQEEGTPAAAPSSEAAAPTSPLAALFDAAVGNKVRTAADALAEPHPNARLAFDSLREAIRALAALGETYATSDPTLGLEIETYRNGLNVVREILAPAAGATRTAADARAMMPDAVSAADRLRAKLH